MDRQIRQESGRVVDETVVGKTKFQVVKMRRVGDVEDVPGPVCVYVKKHSSRSSHFFILKLLIINKFIYYLKLHSTCIDTYNILHTTYTTYIIHTTYIPHTIICCMYVKAFQKVLLLYS